MIRLPGFRPDQTGPLRPPLAAATSGSNGTDDFALGAQQDDAPAALHAAGELGGLQDGA